MSDEVAGYAEGWSERRREITAPLRDEQARKRHYERKKPYVALLGDDVTRPSKVVEVGRR
jgi:hypothetical protein